MGRILDLCGEVAAAADEGTDGLVLPPEAWDRLREEWQDEDIDDALQLVHDSLLQSELVESADSLSARMIDVLGGFGSAEAFKAAQANQANLSLELIGQLARRVARLEEILEAYRDSPSPDRRGFDELQRRLADYGIEDEMEASRAEDARPARGPRDEEDDEEE
jgi:hypothetical protein